MGSLCFHTPNEFGHEIVRVATSDFSLLGNWTVPWTRLKYLQRERVWFLNTFDNGYEIAVIGDERGPELERFRIAHVVASRLSELMKQVIAYLDTNLDYNHLGSTGEWYLEGRSSVL